MFRTKVAVRTSRVPKKNKEPTVFSESDISEEEDEDDEDDETQALRWKLH